MANEESNEVIYFVQVLGAISILGLLIHTFFNKALFFSMCIIFASMLGLLLVQFEMSIRGAMNQQKGFMGIVKKLFHFRNLIIMILLTGWVFDIYINNYTQIKSNEMPPTFYTVSTAFMWVIVTQNVMVVSNFIRKKKEAISFTSGEKNSVFSKLNQLYNAQSSSLNAILNVITFIMVIILYVISELFVTSG
jgi:hypothetical protein